MINIRIPDDLRDRIDQARGDIPRERWIRRALERFLTETWEHSPQGAVEVDYDKP